MNSYLILALAGAGFGLVIVIYKTFKRGQGLAKKLPVNFLVVFLIYALLGLSGLLLNNQIADSPIGMAVLVMLVSLSVGLVMANNLYENWAWSRAANHGKKLLYLIGICLTAIVAFLVVFVLCEHWGKPKTFSGNDLAWYLASVIPVMLLPLLIRDLHTRWNEIPKIKELLQVFRLPVGSAPPFIEPGGATVNFQFIIPLAFRSEEVVKSKVAVPMNKTLADAFHYKLHEHNIVKRFARKIEVAEENKRAKVYGWHFFRSKKIWWGLWVKRYNLNPETEVGGSISNGDTIFVERVKIWEE